MIATLKDSNSPQRVISTLIIGSCLVNSLKNYAATINQLIPELLATFYPVITNEGSCQEYEAVMTTFHDKGYMHALVVSVIVNITSKFDRVTIFYQRER